VAGDRLTGGDKRALLLWVLAGVIGALVGYKYYFQAFPEASVNLQVSREEALQRAQQFAAEMGENVSGYQSAIIFDLNENAKTYLEREVGLKQTNRLLSSELHIWYWRVRFFKPQQEEEFLVLVSPAGQIVGYQHQVPESRAGASLDREAALAKATQFASSKLGINFSEWELLAGETSSTQRTNRRDWSFTWEKQGFRAKDAPYRLEVGLQGDEIGSSQEYLKVPEDWQRSYAQLRAHNDFLTSVAFIPYIAILASALWLGFALTRRGSARWGAAIKIGVAVTALLFCMQLNAWPEARAQYDTNSSYATFLFKQLAGALLFGIGLAIFVTLVLPAGDALYRVTQPGRLRLNKAFTLRGLRSKEFFCSSVVGLSLTAASLGFVVVFYLVGRKFGVWAPQDINYENSVSTLFPWISGVAIGLLASTNEEFTFRLFAIPFIERLTGSRWLAVIIPAFCWSFLHTNYPQEPPYIRGLEVGSLGIITGIVFLRWGILATLIWHYTFDASQVGLLLIRSHSWYFRISGIVVGAAALAPLLFSAISYVQRGAFEADEDLLNGAEPAPDVSMRIPPSEIAAGVASRRYAALAPAMLGLLGLLAVCGAVAVWRLKPPAIGDYLTLSTDARTAKARADAVLRQRGVDPASYRHAAVLVDATNSLANEFLRERIGVPRLNEIYATQVPGALWRVRYFRDSQKEEYAVIVKPDGGLHSVWHVLAEDTPGASLDKDAAVALGETFLRDEKHLDLRQWKLVGDDSQKLPHRIDHTLTWKQEQALNPPASGAGDPAQEAFAQVELQVLGDEVTRYRTYIKIPDEWRRKQEEQTLPRLALTWGAAVLMFVGLPLAMLVIFLRNVKSEAAQDVRWKRVALWSAWALVAFCVDFGAGNRVALALNSYNTAQPLSLSLGELGIELLIGGPFYFACIVVLFGLAWYFARRAFGAESLPGWGGMPADYYRDALFIGVGGTAAFVALGRLLQTAFLYWPTMHREVAAAFGENFDATLPGAAILATAVLRGLLLTALIAAVAAFVAACIPQTWLRVLLFVGGGLALVGGGWGDGADYAKRALAELISLGVVVLGVRYVMRFNLLGCFLVALGTAMAGALAELLGQPDAFYRLNGYAGLAGLAVIFAWPVVGWVSRRQVAAS
jgi:membrane protease YdiL (CAAX protease family)